MTRHIVDTHHATDNGLRLRRFLTIARQAGRHPAIARMLRRHRSRAMVRRCVPAFVQAGRTRRDQARTSFS